MAGKTEASEEPAVLALPEPEASKKPKSAKAVSCFHSIIKNSAHVGYGGMVTTFCFILRLYSLFVGRLPGLAAQGRQAEKEEGPEQ